MSTNLQKMYDELAKEMAWRIEHGIEEEVNTPTGVRIVKRRTNAAEWGKMMDFLKMSGYDAAKSGGNEMVDRIAAAVKAGRVKPPTKIDDPDDEIGLRIAQ